MRMAWNMTEKGREKAPGPQNLLSASLVSFRGHHVGPRFHPVHPVNPVQSRGQKIRVNQACSGQIKADQAILKHFFSSGWRAGRPAGPKIFEAEAGLSGFGIRRHFQGQNLLDRQGRLEYCRLHVNRNAASSGGKRGRRRRRPRRWVLSRLRQISTKLPRLETVVGFFIVTSLSQITI
jgi:hypothetical protein